MTRAIQMTTFASLLARFDARMKEILADAIAVGNATARALVFASRDEKTKYYPDRQWFTFFVGGSYLFMDNGELMPIGVLCFSTTPRASPRRWLRQSLARVRPMPLPPAPSRASRKKSPRYPWGNQN
jgi:hypothetical protein